MVTAHWSVDISPIYIAYRLMEMLKYVVYYLNQGNLKTI